MPDFEPRSDLSKRRSELGGMSDEEILAALEAMKRGERPADPDEPLVAKMDADPVEVKADVSKKDLPQNDLMAPPEAQESMGLRAVDEFERRVPPTDKGMDEVQRLLKEYEDATGRDKRSNAIDRMQAWNVMAGSAVSSGIGGLPENRVSMPPKYKASPSAKDRFEMNETVRKHNMDTDKGDKDRLGRVYIAKENNFTKEEIAESNNVARAERDFKNRTWREGQNKLQRAQQDLSSRRSAAAKIYMADQLAKSGIDRAVAAKIAGEYFDQEEKRNRGWSQKRYIADGNVSAQESNNATKLMNIRSAIEPTFEAAEEIFSEDPRVMAKWGFDERARATTVINKLYEDMIKANKNGVMQEGDLRSVQRILGDPSDAENILSGNMAERIRMAKKILDDSIHEEMISNRYKLDDGTGEKTDAFEKAMNLGSGGFSQGLEQDEGRKLDVLQGKPPRNAKPRGIPGQQPKKDANVIRWSDFK